MANRDYKKWVIIVYEDEDTWNIAKSEDGKILIFTGYNAAKTYAISLKCNHNFMPCAGALEMTDVMVQAFIAGLGENPQNDVAEPSAKYVNQD
tara:strand:+ start:171 stop:449 length:279 start_codon:yes stop_codon:yes gene_type:complete